MNRICKFAATLAASAVLGGFSGAASAAFSGLYVFGDSLSDVGNVAVLVGANPGQVISGNSYIPSTPYASGQFTNGDVWVKSFAAALGQPGGGVASLAPGGGGDFAFGGARMATDGAGLPPSLATQASLFLAAAGGAAPGGALYVVEGGGNDARDTLQAAASSATPSAVIAAAAQAYAQATGAIVDQLQAAGAQRIVVWDVPNLALAPAVAFLGAGASFLGGQVAGAFNNALSLRMAGEAGVSIFDVFGVQNLIVANPGLFGLTNVIDACGAAGACNPVTGLYWDGIHPTAAGHAILAQQMLAAVVPEPGTLLLMVAGMLLIGFRLRADRQPEL